MSIVIETELFLKNWEPYRRIILVKALPIDKIPKEYRDNRKITHLWMREEVHGYCLEIWDPEAKLDVFLKMGAEIPENDFQYKLRLVREAGRNLTKINAKNKQKYKDKLGHYTYYI